MAAGNHLEKGTCADFVNPTKKRIYSDQQKGVQEP